MARLWLCGGINSLRRTSQRIPFRLTISNVLAEALDPRDVLVVPGCECCSPIIQNLGARQALEPLDVGVNHHLYQQLLNKELPTFS